ncbi:MAG: hypothetical protein J5857_11895 [Treponema sp.]|nr:hypothetical protein [Treponema sp.]
MTYIYDESYLADVQKNLGFFFQFLMWNLKITPDNAQSIFLDSHIPYQIEIGNPDYLCGKSGYELAMLALPERDLMKEIEKAVEEPFYPQAEYWCGYVLAYSQWKHSMKFEAILQNYPLALLMQSYNLLHECDITKVDEIIMEKCSEVYPRGPERTMWKPM